jgi:hypothetical protein
VIDLFEMWTRGNNLVHDIFNTYDSILSKALFDHDIIGQGDSLFVNLAISSFVDQLSDGF